MILYIPRLIETVEQAEALPEGTVAICAEDWPVEKSGGLWGRQGYSSSFLADTGDWTALVPIEAEEEWRASWPEDDAHQRCRDERTARLWADQQDAVAMSRLVTPWEPA